MISNKQWLTDVNLAFTNGYNKALKDTANKFVCNAITEFQKFDKEHGYPTLADISVILSDVAEELKEGI